MQADDVATVTPTSPDTETSNISFMNETISSLSSFDIDDFLLTNLGPKQLPLNWLIPLTVVYSIIFLTGIVGNVCTCLVIARNQYMQTATNCYLFNLAIADMLTLFFAMPLELFTLWQQYPWQLGTVTCWLRGVIPEATAYASILTIVTFSTERYVAICHPIRQQTKSRLSHAIRNIGVIWALSAGAALPYAAFTQVNHLHHPLDPDHPAIPESAWCGFPFNDPSRNWEILMLCSTFLFFVVPISLITGLYVRIALALHQSTQLHRCTSESTQCRTERERSKAQSRRAVVRMLVAVVIAFFVCWAPFHAQRLLFLYVSLYGKWTDTLRHVNQNLFTLAGCFYYFNSTINPILYSVMSNRFRVAFREKLCAGPPSLWCICCCCFCCLKDFEKRSQQNQQPPQHFYRNSNSHSSVRSYVSYPQQVKASTGVNNNTLPSARTCLLAVEFDEKADRVVTRPGADLEMRFGRTLTVSPPRHLARIESNRSSSKSSDNRRSGCVESSSSDDFEDAELENELAEELHEAIRPELDKLVEAEKNDCVDCTNCTLLFPPKLKSSLVYYDAVDRTSTTELSQSDHVVGEAIKQELAESVV